MKLDTLFISVRIKEIINYEGDLTYDLKMPDGNPRKLIDSTKIRSLGWRPKTDLEKGIELSYKSFLKNTN